MAKTPELIPKPRKKENQLTKKQAANRMEKYERKLVVAKMRGRGHTMQEIADKTGVSVAQISKDVAEVLDDLALASMKEIVKYRSQLVMQRTAMIEAHLATALDPTAEGFAASAAIVDKNQSAIAKLYGLDAPQVVHQMIEQVEPGTVVEGSGVILEIAGEGNIDWETARAKGEEARKSLNHTIKEKEEEDDAQTAESEGN